ncbi:MAG: hypothetical protein FJ102_13795 [Deltaproteobacteria bacterium]|nr:hypothetical protein [Deltaproteobacteria bacterium]
MLLLLLACSPVTLHDNTRLNLDPFGSEVALASPYAIGAQFEFLLDGPEAEIQDYTLESLDPGVLSVGRGVLQMSESDDTDDRYMSFEATAAGEGSTEVRVYDEDGVEVLRGDVAVKVPDRVELRAASDLDEAENPDPVSNPACYVSGESAFRVDFFHGDTQLAGAGGLGIDDRDQSVATPDDSVWPDDADWVVVAPQKTGEYKVGISSGGTEVAEFSFTGVNDAQIDHIDARRDSESGAEEGDALEVHAWGELDDDSRVYGLSFEWTENGSFLPDVGDTYTYEYDPDVSTTVTASAAGQVMQLEVHGYGYVSDSNSMMCSVLNAGPVAMGVLLATLGVRRKRR